MNLIKNNQLLLLLIYFLFISILFFRINVHPYHYTTPDSLAYLAQSKVILKQWNSGNTFSSIFQVKQGFTIWPIGYPLFISIVSFLTGSTVLFASKIVNFIFIGLCFILFKYWFKKNSWFVSFSFFSYGSLEVFSQTWSETPFIFFVLLLTFLIQQQIKLSNTQLFIGLVFILITLFLIRYVGIIYSAFIGIYGIIYLIKGKRKQGIIYLGATTLTSIISLLYLYHNTVISGYSTGISRISLGHQEPLLFCKLLIQGLFNEFCIARNYFFDHKPPDLLFLGLLSIQVLIIAFFVYEKNNKKHIITLSNDQKILFKISGIYFIGIFILKAFIPIDKFDYRILFPFTMPLVIGVFSWLISQQPIFQKTQKVVILFMLISLGINLPKNYLIQKVKSFQSSITNHKTSLKK